jgi:hypothetical protein
MPNWIKKRVLITVRTYPVPSAKSIEASCTGGITGDGQWMRLFPVASFVAPSKVMPLITVRITTPRCINSVSVISSPHSMGDRNA